MDVLYFYQLCIIIYNSFGVHCIRFSQSANFLFCGNLSLPSTFTVVPEGIIIFFFSLTRSTFVLFPKFVCPALNLYVGEQKTFSKHLFMVVNFNR